jgi:hypothetical protein
LFVFIQGTCFFPIVDRTVISVWSARDDLYEFFISTPKTVFCVRCPKTQQLSGVCTFTGEQFFNLFSSSITMCVQCMFFFIRTSFPCKEICCNHSWYIFLINVTVTVVTYCSFWRINITIYNIYTQGSGRNPNFQRIQYWFVCLRFVL